MISAIAEISYHNKHISVEPETHPLSYRLGAGITSTNAVTLVKRDDKNLAIANGPSMRAIGNRCDGFFYKFIIYGDLEPNFFQKINLHFG